MPIAATGLQARGLIAFGPQFGRLQIRRHHEYAYMWFSAEIWRREAWIGDRITNRKMVYDLSLRGRQREITMHFIVIKRAYTGCPEPKRFSCEIQVVANSPCFKMNMAITSVAIGASGTIEITDQPVGQQSGCGSL